jgi:hypothetical protein
LSIVFIVKSALPKIEAYKYVYIYMGRNLGAIGNAMGNPWELHDDALRIHHIK